VNLGGKHQAHFLKRKGKKKYKERGCPDASRIKMEIFNQKDKGKIDESMTTQKNRKWKNCFYYGKVKHAMKTCWKKTYDLEYKVK
jgi:hypothetical protein